ncbi:MAG: hypothetical protein H3C45_12455 [Bacteroidia bacterium]|nr:hypothetical protein [Bacteroidia bacterium]
MILGTQDKWLRLLLFEFLKDWCLEEFAARYFIEKNGNYANTTSNSEAMKWGCINAELVFKYLYDKFKSKPAPSDWKQYLSGAVGVIGGVVSVVFPAIAPVVLPLAALLTNIAGNYNSIKYDPETGYTSIYKSDGSLLYEKAGVGGTDWGTIALIGAGAFMIYSISKGKREK